LTTGLIWRWISIRKQRLLKKRSNETVASQLKKNGNGFIEGYSGRAIIG
jgi:hypothetical protein